MTRFFFIVCCLYCSALYAETPKMTHQITIDDGLSQSTVSSIYQARDGRMWFATGDGISIYDGENFEYIYRSLSPNKGLQNNYVSHIFEDTDGRIWVGTLGGGAGIYDSDGNTFQIFRVEDGSISANDVYRFSQDSNGTVWAATANGTIAFEKVENGLYQTVSSALSDVWRSRSARSILAVTDEQVLIGTADHGLILYRQTSGEALVFTTDNSDLSGNSIMALFQDVSGGVWIGTEDGGLNFLDLSTLTISQPILLPDQDIESISQGADGRLWFGSWSNGVFVFDPDSNLIENYRAHAGQSQRLSSNTIISMLPGRLGRMWIGTYDGGVSTVSQFADPFKTYFPDVAGVTGPVSRVIWAIEEGVDDDAWIGSKKGLTRLFRSEHRFEEIDLGKGSNDVRAILKRGNRLLLGIRGRGLVEFNWKSNVLRNITNEAGETLLKNDYIRLLMQDKNDNIWVGTHAGLLLLDPKLRIIKHFKKDGTENSLPHDRVRSLYQATDGIIWVGTSGGLSRYNPKRHNFTNFSGTQYLPDNDVRAIYQHSDGILYVATQAGFVLMDHDQKVLQTIQRPEGLPNETLYSLLPDGLGNLWITTNNGLVRYNIEDDEIDVFKTRDGLQGSEYNFNAHAVFNDGTIAVGGINGVSFFNPENLKPNDLPPRVSFEVTSQNSQPYSEDALETAPADVQFEIKVIHYSEAEANSLQWKLEPVDDVWIKAYGPKHIINRGNLPAGSYTLKYQGFSASGVSEPARSYNFHVKQRIALRWYSIFFYIVLSFVLAAVIFRYRTYVLLQRNVELEMIVQSKTGQLLQANKSLEVAHKERSHFYTRIAHEIRTPISLIKAPIQTVENSQTLTDKNRALLSLVKRAVDRLTRLTDEMSSVAQHDRDLSIGTVSVDVGAFIEPIVSFYHEAAKMQNIRFTSLIDYTGAATLDVEALETTLHNLLSNALKNTNSEGAIEFSLDAHEDALIVKVTNDGIIPQFVVDNLVGFYEGSEEQALKGLEIVAAMIYRIKGRLEVQHDPATFTVWLPAHYIKQQDDDLKVKKLNTLQKNILVIEDDFELREYLSEALCEIGSVTTVASITAARRAVDSNAQHLIICDVMLPDGNGFDFVTSLKAAPETSHIPVIFLTALSDDRSYQKGLDAYSDDYLTKPFDLKELLAKARIRLKNTDALREYAKVSAFDSDKPSGDEAELSPVDERFLRCVEEFIDDNLANANASVKGAATHCAMSKRAFQRKFEGVYGMGFGAFLIQRKMELAFKLLENQMPIKEISLRCGYENQSNFARKFKQFTGVCPTEYRERIKTS